MRKKNRCSCLNGVTWGRVRTLGGLIYSGKKKKKRPGFCFADTHTHTPPNPQWDELLYKHSNMEPLDLEGWALRIKVEWLTEGHGGDSAPGWKLWTSSFPTKYRHKTPGGVWSAHCKCQCVCVCSYHLKVNEKRSNLNFTRENKATKHQNILTFYHRCSSATQSV